MTNPSLGIDARTAVELEPEELAAKLLFLIRQLCKENSTFKLRHDDLQTRSRQYLTSPGETLPNFILAEYWTAFSEAWAWLEVQGLLVPERAPQGDVLTGYRRLSRRAALFQDEVDVRNYAAARRLPKDSLHPAIAEKAWAGFIRGEFDIAVLQAMKAVEVAVRELSGLHEKDGVQLMHAAFKENGPLTDDSVPGGEQVGRQQLFAGAYAAYRNPHAHREVPLDDPTEAIEIVMLANHLLRIVDARRKALEEKRAAAVQP